MIGRATVSLSRRTANLGAINACTVGMRKNIAAFGARIYNLLADTHRLPLLDDQKEDYSFECGKPRASSAASLAAQCYCGATCGVSLLVGAVLVRLYNCAALQ